MLTRLERVLDQQCSPDREVAYERL
jgi:hypothetical protein